MRSRGEKLKEELAKVLETDLNKVLEGEDKAPIEKAFAVMLLPPLAKFRQVEVEAQVRFALFQAAIAVLLRGEKELQKTKDPLGGAPFRLQKTDNGFDLVSQVKDKEGNPVRISIPKK